MKKHWSDWLVACGACSEAVEWARTQPSASAAWKACKRADWMLWIAARMCTTEKRRKEIAFAACACARTALRYLPDGEKRPLGCIRVVERWTRGEATLAEVREAKAAAYAATATATAAYAATYAAAAADAYAYATAATAAATYAATYAAYAYAYAYAATAADYADARSKALAKMANLVRKNLSMPRLPKAKS